MSMQGYSGSSYDRFVERNETSTLHKFKETFWTTKQAVIQKLGKKEDEHVVASDAELDSKLEVFKAIQKSCMELLRAIEKYQDRLCALSMEENATGRFLKANSGQDKTRAGKMMAAVGKSQSFSAQQRLALRVPLVRLYQEVETFRYRAISDTLMTINRMEGARTEYRGALLWMKDVSEQLDPDTYKQLEKFRKVQAQVKKTKARFDKLKLDVMQKIDLLAASRCNMFSHVLANYQSSLLHFWEKTSRTMTAVAESFKGYQYYEFSIIKERKVASYLWRSRLEELQEPAKKLADTTREPAERDIGDDFDPENESLYSGSGSSSSVESLESFDEFASHEPPRPAPIERLVSLEEDSQEQKTKEDNSSLQNLYTGQTELSEGKSPEVKEDRTKPDLLNEPFLDFGDEGGELPENFDFSATIPSLPSIDKKMPVPKNVPKDLLSDDLEPEDTEKDDMTILNEILNAPSAAGEDDFSREWQAVFGHTPLNSGTTLTPGEPDQSQNSAEFMPSNLLDMNQQMAELNLGAVGGVPVSQPPAGPVTQQNPGSQPANQNKPVGGAKPKQGKKDQKDMSAWFSLFADLDPLADPDSVGKKGADPSDACMG